MSQTPEDLSLPSHDAGVLFRAEMASQNLLLGYWKVLVGAVVAVLVVILVYGQYTSWNKGRQQGYAADIARIEIPVMQILPTLAYDPSMVVPADLGKVTTAAAELVQLGDSASGPAAAEAYLKAGEMYRLLGDTDKQLAAYDAAQPFAEGDLVFAVGAARAGTLVDADDVQGAIAGWQSLSTDFDGELGAYALMQLARTQRLAGDIPGATASYDALMTQYPESPLATPASDERSGLSDRAATPAPAVPAPVVPAVVPEPMDDAPMDDAPMDDAPETP